MALVSSKDQEDVSSSESVVILDGEANEHEKDQGLTRKASLHQVQSGHSLHLQQSAGIPPVLEADFRPTTRLYLAFGTLAVITLMVALDGTSLSVALPVSYLPHPSHSW